MPNMKCLQTLQKRNVFKSGPGRAFRREEICSDRQVDNLQFLMNAMEGTMILYIILCTYFPNAYISLSFLLIIVSGKLIYFGL